MNSAEKCGLILVAGGSGNRFQSFKQFEIVNGKPVYRWSLETFFAQPFSGNAVVVVPEDWLEEIQVQVSFYGEKNKRIKVVRGGSSRQASATAGFEALMSFLEPSPWVMVHDAARPCASAELFARLWDARGDVQGVIPGLPVRDTIKLTQKVRDRVLVSETPSRADLYAIQTPQLFPAAILKDAYEKFATFDAADDATLVEKLGHEVIVVPGQYDNLKITFREDLDSVSCRLRQ